MEKGVSSVQVSSNLPRDKPNTTSSHSEPHVRPHFEIAKGARMNPPRGANLITARHLVSFPFQALYGQMFEVFTVWSILDDELYKHSESSKHSVVLLNIRPEKCR